MKNIECVDLIYDLSQVENFFERVWNRLDKDQLNMVQHVHRDKWVDNGKNKTTCLGKRFIKNNSFPEFKRKLQRLEGPACSYYIEDDENEERLLSEKGMAIYAIVNPRAGIEAFHHLNRNATSLLIDQVDTGSIGKKSFYKKMKTLRWTLDSNLHKFPGEKQLMILDLDQKSEFDLVAQTMKDAGIEPVLITETFGGYHFILDRHRLNPLQSKTLYEKLYNRTFQEPNVRGEMVTKKVVDFLNDGATPIPGTKQGGFCVKIVK
jgi:hypothetical protein